MRYEMHSRNRPPARTGATVAQRVFLFSSSNEVVLV